MRPRRPRTGTTAKALALITHTSRADRRAGFRCPRSRRRAGPRGPQPFRSPPRSPSALAIRSGVMGRCVRRAPVASATALATAAAGGPMGGSPMPRALDGSALDLTLDGLRVDRAPHIVGRDVLHEAYGTGFHVDLDLGRVGAEGVIGEDLARPGSEVHGLARRSVVDGEVAPRYALPC